MNILNINFLGTNRYFIIFLISICSQLNCQEIATLKYNGGGDWYANPTALPNLIAFANSSIHSNLSEIPNQVDVGSIEIYNYPLLFMTGHGNVLFSKNDAENLRKYLMSGGFLHISDNYGIDAFVRREFKKVFPELEFVEIPFDHPIFNQTFNFENGLPKIHEHDNKPPQGFGLFFEGRLVCFYDYECDLSDGWEDSEVHNDDPSLRSMALRMGTNIIEYAFKN